jgi:beta-N-acetylhexosaminidase
MAMAKKTIKFLFTACTLALGSVLMFLALDWRSPLLTSVRPWALAALVGVSLLLVCAQGWSLRASRPDQWLLRILNSLSLLMAVFALAATLALECRFQWTRYEVLHADPIKLEYLGRHLIVGCRSIPEVRKLVSLKAISGVFLSGHNARDKGVKQLCEEIWALQRIREEQGLPPLWITTDQEGGVVSRLSPPLTRMPPLAEVVAGCSDDVSCERTVRQYAKSQARELASVGVNVNFAPVVDVNHRVVNPQDRFTRIYRRAISTDPGVVAQVAGWYCAELERAGIRCTLKHFPGLGRVHEDTHLSGASLSASVPVLMATDWFPFRSLMSGDKALVMLGHVYLTAIDSTQPASISPGVIAGLLRSHWQYDGLLITDDFCMRSIYDSRSGMEDGAVQALNAGMDLILVSWDPDQYYRVMYALLQASQHGLLDNESLSRSDERLSRLSPHWPSSLCK